MTLSLIIPPEYRSLLTVRETEIAIHQIKSYFQENLAFELNLLRVTAPLFVRAGTGINDNLNGVERPVSFQIKNIETASAEIVQSLAKWKRLHLADFAYQPGCGIYTDMNAIRPDEIMDNLHSLYVDQWDWERVMNSEERNLNFLKTIVCRIYDVIRRTERYVCYLFPLIEPILPDTITFVHSEELEVCYPDMEPRGRELSICQEHGAVFLIGIGGVLANGNPHDGRAPDYDDWSTPSVNGYKGLNGDILVHYPILDCVFELSSMGIRVDEAAMLRQLEITGNEERKTLLFHSRLLAGELPQSIGGGIGQSRLCMFYLRKAHIGEIQSSLWPEEMIQTFRAHNIVLL